LSEPKKIAPLLPGSPAATKELLLPLREYSHVSLLPSHWLRAGLIVEASDAAKTSPTTCLLVNDAKLQHLSRATLDSSRQHRVKAALLSDIYSTHGQAKGEGEIAHLTI